MSDVWNEFPMEVAEPAKEYQKVRASAEGIIIKADGQITTEPEEPPDHDDIKSQVRAGTMSINEARRLENFPPVAWGDEKPAPAEPAKDFLFAVMAKVSAASLEDAEDHLYATLCIPGDIGFSINSYAIIAGSGNQLKFKEIDAERPEGATEIARLFDVPVEPLRAAEEAHREREHDKFASEAVRRWFEQIDAKLKDMDYPNYQPTEAEIADMFREIKATYEREAGGDQFTIEENRRLKELLDDATEIFVEWLENKDRIMSFPSPRERGVPEVFADFVMDAIVNQRCINHTLGHPEPGVLAAQLCCMIWRRFGEHGMGRPYIYRAMKLIAEQWEMEGIWPHHKEGSGK